MEKIKLQQQEESGKKEYLNPGVPPIISCLDIAEGSSSPQLSGGIEQIDLYADPEKVRLDGFLKEGKMAYIISPIDNCSKFSIEYKNCTGIVAVGIDKETNENISFMSHQNPSYFLLDDKEKFVRDLNQRLFEMKERCEVGTVDIRIFGGQFLKVKEFDENHKIQDLFKGEYIASIKLLCNQVENQFGFSPDIVTGPKFDKGQDLVAFDNEKRRLYLTRGIKDSRFTNNFNAKEIDEHSNSWKPGEIGIDEYLKAMGY